MSSEPFCLLTTPWLPVRRRSGAREWIAPHQIADRADADPVLRPDWGRADLDAATLEFLIGLLATCCPPDGVRDWLDRHRNPPSTESLAAAFTPFAHAFRLDGDGPRFMQEWGDLAGETKPAESLLIDAPGENTLKNNADLFQKRGRLPQLGRPAAAIALFALQTYAPSGGAGHRTSLRGGGPLTTLAVPPGEETLWSRLWLNVPEAGAPLPDDLSRVFPWLAPTRTSEGKAPPLSEDDIDARGVFWGMPRRIQLDVEPGAGAAFCALTGETADVVVKSYRTRPWGMNYGPLAHPLSPMYRQKIGAEWLYVHPQPGGLSYRNWIDMAAAGEAEAALRRAAPAVLDAKERLRALRAGRARLWAAGYDMDNMKARGFVEARFPLFPQPDIDGPARLMVEAAQDAAFLAVGAIRSALGIDAAEASAIMAVREDFFGRTQAAFFDTLDALNGVLADGGPLADAVPQLMRRFLETALRPEALFLFDLQAPLLHPEAREAERIVAARLGLVLALGGYGRQGRSLFGKLSLPPPETGAGGRRAVRAQETES